MSNKPPFTEEQIDYIESVYLRIASHSPPAKSVEPDPSIRGYEWRHRHNPVWRVQVEPYYVCKGDREDDYEIEPLVRKRRADIIEKQLREELGKLHREMQTMREEEAQLKFYESRALDHIEKLLNSIASTTQTKGCETEVLLDAGNFLNKRRKN